VVSSERKEEEKHSSDNHGGDTSLETAVEKGRNLISVNSQFDRSLEGY
jgi:hypothetical protein